jgi:hypothetical protein
VWSIRGFVGPNGSGKTLAAINEVAIPAWREGRPVMANFQLYPDRLGFDPALFRPLRRWEDLTEFAGGSVIFDEVTTVASSRASHRMPPEFAALLQQLRKADIELAWTAPAWARCEIILRECSQAVTMCRGYMMDRFRRVDPDPTEEVWWRRAERDDDGRPVRVRRAWRPNRWFVWRTYDAFAFDEFSHYQAERLRPLQTQRRWVWQVPARGAYDTLEGVSLLGHLTQTEKQAGGVRAADPAAGRGPLSHKPTLQPVGRAR